ncbi:phosphatase PAP2 family protein, partial [Mesorhizobium sp. M2E.F.Ca.ET.154.01.1.1]|uniref:phosphatase PAP2 family protein n=1 Tax=Mesorhizobium sp. M2E.F.Ca.ET.154.01.1.1 TaxID=2500521 RepID=UPI00127CE596
ADRIYPIWALSTQDMLWGGYTGATSGSIGISALPSMHVAMAGLFALYATRRSRLAGVLMWAFSGIIMIASVALGWHYALDGYAGALLSVAIWKACGYFLSRFAPEGVSEAQEQASTPASGRPAVLARNQAVAGSPWRT